MAHGKHDALREDPRAALQGRARGVSTGPGAGTEGMAAEISRQRCCQWNGCFVSLPTPPSASLPAPWGGDGPHSSQEVGGQCSNADKLGNTKAACPACAETVNSEFCALPGTGLLIFPSGMHVLPSPGKWKPKNRKAQLLRKTGQRDIKNPNNNHLYRFLLFSYCAWLDCGLSSLPPAQLISSLSLSF